jgi:hypothetical protein
VLAGWAPGDVCRFQLERSVGTQGAEDGPDFAGLSGCRGYEDAGVGAELVRRRAGESLLERTIRENESGVLMKGLDRKRFRLVARAGKRPFRG